MNKCWAGNGSLVLLTSQEKKTIVYYRDVLNNYYKKTVFFEELPKQVGKIFYDEIFTKDITRLDII
jgi:hypothetical protein